MRNDSKKWLPSLSQPPAPIEYEHLQVRCIDLDRQAILSGSRKSALEHSKLKQASQWPDPASRFAIENSYAISLRRDRILVINGPEMSEGWHEDARLAVSDFSFGYRVIEVNGNSTMNFLRRGTELNPEILSGSALRNFSGFEVILYPWEHFESFRIHVEAPFFDGFWLLVQQLAENTSAHAEMSISKG